jgi:hypothetical protein
MPAHPVLALCPYLRLDKAVEFGGWWLGPAARFARPWLRPSFEKSARTFLTCCMDPSGKPLTNPSILARDVSGADGELPPEAMRDALQAAIHFATIDANPAWSGANATSSWDTWRTATSDNSELFFWPLEDEGRWFTVRRGSTSRTGRRLRPRAIWWLAVVGVLVERERAPGALRLAAHRLEPLLQLL